MFLKLKNRLHLYLPVKAILQCGDTRDKDITLTKLFTLKPRCTLRTKKHTIINPVHYNHNTTLKLSKETQQIMDIDMNIENHVNNVLQNYTFQKLTNIKWNEQLNDTNKTLSIHKATIDLFPTSSITIGTGTIIAMIIVAIIIFCIHKKYHKLKHTFRNIQRLYKRGENSIPRDISEKKLTQVERSNREEPKLKKIKKNIRKPLKATKKQKEVTYLTVYEEIEDDELEYIPMTRSIQSEPDSPEGTLRRKEIREVRVLPEIPEDKQEVDGTPTSSEMDLDR